MFSLIKGTALKLIDCVLVYSGHISFTTWVSYYFAQHVGNISSRFIHYLVEGAVSSCIYHYGLNIQRIVPLGYDANYSVLFCDIALPYLHNMSLVQVYAADENECCFKCYRITVTAMIPCNILCF